MSDLVIDCAFAEIGNFKDAVVDRLSEIVLLLQIWNYLVGYEPLHLERDAGKADDGAFVGFNHECGSGAVGVANHGGAVGDLGLTLVVFGQDESAVLESLMEFD